MLDGRITPIDKIISALSYLSGGLVGIVWQIICAVNKKPISKFLIFNIYQAVFLTLFLYVVNVLFSMAVTVLILIPFLKILVNTLIMLLMAPQFSVVACCIFLVYAYLITFCLMGRIAYLPWISNIILYQLNRF